MDGVDGEEEGAGRGGDGGRADACQDGGDEHGRRGVVHEVHRVEDPRIEAADGVVDAVRERPQGAVERERMQVG